jgi:Rps23 Pro-64 3,4-dihydroxylase Tpa1-like proline 4-hydroxylase
MNKIEYASDIFVYEDFISKEEAENLIKWLNYIVSIKKIDWNPISFYESYAMGFYEEDPTLELFGFPKDYMHKLKLRIQSTTEDAMQRPVKEVSYHAQKWIPGAFAGFHSDNSTDGEYNAFERSKFATFLYLNDDFVGGELNFKDHPITIKPKAGMLATFAGGHHNEHEVRLVEESDRYTIGSFWDYAEAEYSEEKQAEWARELAEVRALQAEEIENWKVLREKGERIMPYQGPEYV